MFNNLKIKSHKVINEVRLLNLSRISVVCGPNNSGKSTFLRAINDTKIAFPGKQLGDEEIEQIFSETLSDVGWPQDRHHHKYNEVYKSIISEIAKEQDAWFLDEKDAFVNKVIEKCRSITILHRQQINGIAIANCFYKLIKSTISPIIIPPKRVLQTTVNVNTSDKVAPNGSGLINYLFAAKNQPNMSTGRRIYESIATAFYNISDGYQFAVFVNKEANNSLSLQFCPAGDLWLPATECGLGLQDLLTILYYSVSPDVNLICIEEPESHFHPDMQRRLLVYLKEINDRQFVLTTHSNVFLNNALIDRVLITSYSNKKITITDATSRASALDDLGYSVADNLVSDVVVLVEGPTDVSVLEEFFLKKGLLGKYDIKIWPLGGDIMAQLDLDVFTQSYSIISLIDKDPGSSSVRKKFAKKCKESGIPLHILKGYATENYFSLRALRVVFGSQIPDTVKKIAMSKKLENQIGIDVKKNNRKIAKEMTLKEIEGTDLLEFFNKVEALCKKTTA